ncbi:hydrolase [Actinoplanes sp. OR16]|uniref:alpha/beta fold hydrolase n=1 Tax=Actinoplanes sp. OR16 TaxID=946334 RepID=UPI000F6CF8DB|nr:alpha/beta hydrolase [Actinoplanes sp. OR16]BBH70504.1 hydrolase [Actinoplanes sp. OR16]
MPIYAGADGAPLHYDDTDSGSAEAPLIVLAGGAARHPAYLGDLGGLGASRRLVVPHLRGVGESAAGRAKAGSYWRQASDLEGLRSHLGLERIALAGHSAGTRLATAYAAQFPDRLERLVLITPPATHLVAVAPDAAELIARRTGEPAFDAAVAASRRGPDLSSEDAFNSWHLTCAPLGYAAWTAKEQQHATIGRWSLPAVQAYFSVNPPEDFAERLGKVTTPVRVIAGAEDCLTGLAPVVALADVFPNGDVTVIEDCGHYPWVEKPAAFLKAATD